MNRNDILLVGCGGCGGKLADTIIDIDTRFNGFFINASNTDLESLNNINYVDKNFICTSRQNGTGRNIDKGLEFLKPHGNSILEALLSFDQETLFFESSLGGGSGTSSIIKLFEGIDKFNEENPGIFTKIVNLIAVLPRLDSPSVFLENTLRTWNTIMKYKCVNNMIFIDNNSFINGRHLSEDEINDNFAELFNAIFDIPLSNGRNFDNGNLGNIINSKGCTYIYNLEGGMQTIEEAIKDADEHSILAKMYTSKDNLINDDENKLNKIRCSYLGTSFNDENYKYDEVLKKYKVDGGEHYYGYNEEDNLLIVSGCLPPLNPIKLIAKELEDRNKTASIEKNSNNLNKFIIDSPVANHEEVNIKNNNQVNSKVAGNNTNQNANQNNNNNNNNRSRKKVFKKNLFNF